MLLYILWCCILITAVWIDSLTVDTAILLVAITVEGQKVRKAKVGFIRRWA